MAAMRLSTWPPPPGTYPSIVVAGCGYGSECNQRERFQKDANEVADRS